MQISEKTLKILKNFTGINESIRIKPGNVIETCSKTQSIYACATVEETFPVEFTIYNLAQFISIVSLFNEPDITFDSKYATIKSGKKKVSYTFSEPAMIIHPPDDGVQLSDVTASFKIEEYHLANLAKARGILKLPEVRFVGSDDNVLIEAVNTTNPTDNTFSESLDEGTIVKPGEFSMLFKADNLVVIPSAYEVSITEAYAHFRSDDIQYFIAAEA